ncbi:32 kDa beta-galactoside-binding lectin isoform X3 [Polyergus mexicanus]|uniref:32 kDa beta-galactoside-binding lectin isoform X3 n=1 Tax=Polyergus mexicanus TaxID=615972 RepID=UPI0038B575C0
MSSLSNNIHILARQEAFKDFSYFDEETVPANVGKLIPLQPLKPTSSIILTGYIPENASRFSVNLTCKTSGNIALHFNPRLDRGYIVRNTKVRGSWEDEETCSPAGSSGCIFRRNTYVHLMIFCTNDAFQDVPITVGIGSEFRVGASLFIVGRLKLLPHSFYVNLQRGKTIYPHPLISLHLNPRFLYGNSAPYVVMNCWNNGTWDHEERHQGHLSWMPGRDFLLTIRCEYEGYTIWLGSKMIGEFKHRLQSTIVDTLRISGDVVLYQLSMN